MRVLPVKPILGYGKGHHGTELGTHKIIVPKFTCIKSISCVGEPLPKVHLHKYEPIPVVGSVVHVVAVLQRIHHARGLKVVSASARCAGIHKAAVSFFDIPHKGQISAAIFILGHAPSALGVVFIPKRCGVDVEIYPEYGDPRGVHNVKYPLPDKRKQLGVAKVHEPPLKPQSHPFLAVVAQKPLGLKFLVIIIKLLHSGLGGAHHLGLKPKHKLSVFPLELPSQPRKPIGECRTIYLKIGTVYPQSRVASVARSVGTPARIAPPYVVIYTVFVIPALNAPQHLLVKPGARAVIRRHLCLGQSSARARHKTVDKKPAPGVNGISVI